jgi:hypothetical protein
MRITDEELSSNGINIKRWIAEMQKAARGPEAPTFELKGACVLNVRSRRATGTVAVKSKNMPFVGGEKFRLSSFVDEYDPSRMTHTVSIALVPATPSLAGEISGLTLSMIECVSLLEGFEDWVGTFASAKYAEPSKKPPSIKEEHEANPSWGSW